MAAYRDVYWIGVDWSAEAIEGFKRKATRPLCIALAINSGVILRDSVKPKRVVCCYCGKEFEVTIPRDPRHTKDQHEQAVETTFALLDLGLPLECGQCQPTESSGNLGRIMSDESLDDLGMEKRAVVETEKEKRAHDAQEQGKTKKKDKQRQKSKH